MNESNSGAIGDEFLVNFNFEDKKRGYFSSEQVLGTFTSNDDDFSLELLGINHYFIFIRFLLLILFFLGFQYIINLNFLTTNSRAKEILTLISIFTFMSFAYYFLVPYIHIFLIKYFNKKMSLKFGIGFSNDEKLKNKLVQFSIQHNSNFLPVNKIDKLKKRRITLSYLISNEKIECLAKFQDSNKYINWSLRFLQWKSFPLSSSLIVFYPKYKKM